jgi:hypothetical protein
VLYVAFGDYVSEPGDEQKVGKGPGGSAVLDSMASPVLLRVINDTHIGAGREDGEADGRGGKPVLGAPILDR